MYGYFKPYPTPDERNLDVYRVTDARAYGHARNEIERLAQDPTSTASDLAEAAEQYLTTVTKQR